MTTQLDHIFAALADPTRRAILAMLLEDDMAVTDVAEPFQMSLAAISKHLGVLTAAGLICQEKRGRVKWCKLEPDALRDASVWMQAFGQMDAIDLDAFEAFLAQQTQTPRKVDQDPRLPDSVASAAEPSATIVRPDTRQDQTRRRRTTQRQLPHDHP